MTTTFNSTEIILQAWKDEKLEASEACEMLRERTGEKYIYTQEGHLVPIDDAFYCEFSEDYYATEDEFITVHVGRNQEKYGHPDEINYFTCERCEENFAEDNFSAVDVEGETVCLERYGDEIYYWDSDGDYHWEPEPEEDDVIPEYHSQYRQFRAEGECFGLEIEVKARDGGDLQNIRDLCDRHDVICERDGSLDDHLGVELVFPPLNYGEVSSLGAFLSKMSEYAKGWNAGSAYGMHISLNIPNYSLIQISRAIVWMEENKAFCEQLAGRSENPYCRYVKKSLQDIQNLNCEKYEAMALRSITRLECRIFRSNLSLDGVLRNVQFLKALMSYCAEKRKASFTKHVRKHFPQFTQLITKL